MGISEGLTQIENAIGSNPLAAVGIAAGAGVIAGAGATGLLVAATNGKKRSKNRVSRKRNRVHRKIKHTKRGWKQDRKRRSKQKWEVAYRKRKRSRSSRGSKRVRYARKTGQPYIILASGKAKFIKGKRRKS